MDRKEDYIKRIIPHRLGMVESMHFALKEMVFEDGAKPMEIYVDGNLKIQGNTNAYFNPVIESGIINARALLEFLGLKVDPRAPSKLKERTSKKNGDDLFIEDFENGSGGLPKVTIEDIKNHYPGPKNEAVGSLARIIHISNKDIAHPTLGRQNTGDDFTMLEIAARGIQALTVSFFFTKLGLPAPQSHVNVIHAKM